MIVAMSSHEEYRVWRQCALLNGVRPSLHTLMSGTIYGPLFVTGDSTSLSLLTVLNLFLLSFSMFSFLIPHHEST